MLSDIEKIGLSKLISSRDLKESRELVEPGLYQVDFTIHVKGEVAVSHDGEKAATSRLLNLGTVALLLQYAGVTREAAMVALEKTFREIGDNPELAKNILTERPEVKEIHDRVKREIVTKMPRIPVKGSVRVNGVEIERVEVRGPSLIAEAPEEPEASEAKGLGLAGILSM